MQCGSTKVMILLCPKCGAPPKARCGAGCIGEYGCSHRWYHNPPFLRTLEAWNAWAVNPLSIDLTLLLCEATATPEVLVDEGKA